MDTISYSYADEAHDRISELEKIVTQSGDIVTISGDVEGVTNVNSDGTIDLVVSIVDDSHYHTIDTLTGLQDLIIETGQLQLVTENGNTGWRLLGKNADNYGIIGDKAIDLSHSDDLYEPNGATGNISFATGEGTIAKNSHSFALGRYNLPKDDTILEVGIGSDKNSRKNALEIYNNGKILTPELSEDKIIDDKSLVTKQYIDNLVIDGGVF